MDEADRPRIGVYCRCVKKTVPHGQDKGRGPLSPKQRATYRRAECHLAGLSRGSGGAMQGAHAGTPVFVEFLHRVPFVRCAVQVCPERRKGDRDREEQHLLIGTFPPPPPPGCRIHRHQDP